MIPYGRQNISGDDIAAVIDVLHSEWLTQGPGIASFEQALAAACKAKHAIAVSNATGALHIACLALGVGQGDVVWTSPNTFVASANCARYCGADVDFVDIDPQTLNICVKQLADKLEHARTAGRLPKVVIPVHFSGRSCDMEAIAALGKKYGFRIIEDASHAVGAEHLGMPVGACQFSDIAIFSFHPVKIITTGEGGMLMTNDTALAKRLGRLRTHGIAQSAEELLSPLVGPWEYQQVELGFNYRMTNLQAALGLSQLKRLPEFIARRRQLARQYHELLADLPIVRPLPSDESAWHLYAIRVPADRRLEVFTKLREAQVWVQVHYMPVHTQAYYRNLGFGPGDFPEAEDYFSKAFSLPLYYGLTDEEQLSVVALLRSYLA
ncbi:UDP-4-amino-4,6-dideoxy-N-acetyl-beta-L-altrosamine transaminase [Pseudomonas sichuanensis]|uniref:UDP-4-amino-4, 6-dideoxy-N-acetyl-beta-L-altrosamine transaminase n=1 Tax=Pseudomonas sichuanensis TaxID=2213015 RepID=UPI00215E7783|nr:UDP-4-amino-4,6-dideoxy-N-acetyl-beta-L-altrosamine transaminase [Pseudomonas sichuanensis]MDZ4017823.1 UDP-4-amino-4-deoxy-L-arabinose--oxoglutarate aminotransferase [Pseudomonas sichuanensis]UVL90714.1 UDP-4-amino-4,6-dideoxy-N-acetyl-beta-L-altrosamine transaminase [Pseudomonas sichuanensis]